MNSQGIGYTKGQSENDAPSKILHWPFSSQMLLVQRCREYTSNLTCDYMFPPGTWERKNLFPSFCVTLVQRNEIWERGCNYSCKIYAWESLHLIIYFIYLFINFVKRPGSLTEQGPLWWSTTRSRKEKRKKKKIRNKNINKNDNTLETTKKSAMKTELGRTLIKNRQLIRSSKLFSGRPVWHLIYTLLKV